MLTEFPCFGCGASGDVHPLVQACLVRPSSRVVAHLMTSIPSYQSPSFGRLLWYIYSSSSTSIVHPIRVVKRPPEYGTRLNKANGVVECEGGV